LPDPADLSAEQRAGAIKAAHQMQMQLEAYQAAVAAAADVAKVWKDATGNVLQDGDTVTLVKDLKIKGSSSVVKVGTKVKNIRLIEGDHDIDCKIEGFGPMQLKTEFVKKA
jgi:protein PhnA